MLTDESKKSSIIIQMDTPITQTNFEIKNQPSDSITEPLLGSDLAIAEYTSFRDKNDKELRVGIFGEDLASAIASPDTISITYIDENNSEVKVPALVPIDNLEWYNTDLIRRTYGSTEGVYCYVHPPINSDEDAAEVISLLQSSIDQGKVIVTEKYAVDQTSPIAQIVDFAKSDASYEVEAFGGKTDSRVDFFSGYVKVREGNSDIFQAPSLEEVFNDAVASGEMERDSVNGPDLVGIIDDKEAEQIWDVYEKPFEGLGKDDPTLAGFDKDTLLEILKDPSITKIVNRADGQITTLMIFLQDFEKAPWFNKHKYAQNYSRYYETGNVLIFPGIVTDESKRGNDYATNVIDFTSELLARRGSDFLITFECTEESTTYIPKLVQGALEHAGYLSVNGLESPIGQIEYFALSRAKSKSVQ